jgi:hypothetical protein
MMMVERTVVPIEKEYGRDVGRGQGPVLTVLCGFVARDARQTRTERDEGPSVDH